ncbi:MAG: hypothetical protein CR984_05160 [Proteobacteria bacterium]|nr:MAG: hypothetical protein CR984_05160 [Pseudomonadota bacterium]PIE67523.1 MAG: hypothetical protein CSA23_03600 [Deltaproteobacteria bacterium]
MKRRFYAPAVLLVGLLCAQAVATVHVYHSNLALQKNTLVIARTGYLAVPNAYVAKGLDQLTIAFAGGLFFTLSIGAGLSVLTLAAVWLWNRVFRRRRRALTAGLLTWFVLIGAANGNGWNPAASAYLVMVPLATALAAMHLMPARTTLITPAGIFWPVAAILVLAVLWGLVLDNQMFVTIRDHLLLGNRVGIGIARAYYGYTLYPAETFRPIDQRQLRTCGLDKSLDRSSRNRIERISRMNDCLPVPDGAFADMTFSRADGTPARLALQHKGKTVMRVAAKELFGNPHKVLAAFSERLDRNRNFRKMTLAGLLLGFPLVLFTLAFSLLGALPNLFLPVALADMLTAVICVGLGTLLLVPVYRGHNAAVAADNPGTALSTGSPAIRIQALQAACKQKRDITAAALKHGIDKSAHVAERYWLARSLANARHLQAPSLLMQLAADREPIVACQALWAMGKRGNRGKVPDIMERINTSPHWYVQMYGYRALRSLGWVQPRSPQVAY